MGQLPGGWSGAVSAPAIDRMRASAASAAQDRPSKRASPSQINAPKPRELNHVTGAGAISIPHVPELNATTRSTTSPRRPTQLAYIVKSLHRTRSFLIVFLSQGLAHDVCLRPIWSHQELANKLNPDTPAVKREVEEDWGPLEGRWLMRTLAGGDDCCD